MQQLATLAQVKAWIPKLTSTDDDVLLTQLLTRVSGGIMGNLCRADVGVRTVTETINGKGTSSIFMREWPVVSISSLLIDGRIITAAQSFNSIGYTFVPWDNQLPGMPQQLSLRGSSFYRGVQNISLSYVAGYITSENQTVAAGAAVTDQTDGAWASDQGVTYVNGGEALQKVTGAPAVGQYQLNAATPGGYTFNAADDAAEVNIKYGFIPAPLNQACVEIVAERYRYRSRIGLASTSVDGKEVATYDLSAVSKYVALSLQTYKRVTL